MCVFHERQRDICRRRAYSQGFVKVVYMSIDRQHLILHKPLMSTTLAFLRLIISKKRLNLLFLLPT